MSFRLRSRNTEGPGLQQLLLIVSDRREERCAKHVKIGPS